MANFTPPAFHTLTIRLEKNNFTFWRSQILATVRAHGYDEFLLATRESIPPPYHNEDDDVGSVPNPAYNIWIRKDQYLFSWLLNSIHESMLGHVHRCAHSFEIWNVFDDLFRSQSKARVMHLRLKLQTSKKGDLTVDEYMMNMRFTADCIASAGHPILDEELMLHILGGLGPKYESVVVNLTMRPNIVPLSELQAILQTHEMRIATSHQSPVVMDVSSSGSSHFSAQTTPSANYASSTYHNSGKSSRGGGSGKGSTGRGRGFVKGSYSGIVCQLCGKKNHIAAKCFKRFDVNFQGLENFSPNTQPSNTYPGSQPPSHYQANMMTTTQYNHPSTQSHHVDYVQPFPQAYVVASSVSAAADSDWYINSGATHHVTSTMDNLSVQTPYQGFAQPSGSIERHP